ncbi:hypothetical protein MTO96_028156 [Rhipicephalus appendiculatus]
MLHTARPMELLRRDRLFEVSFSDYVGTMNGLFNFLEVCGGCAVFLMMDQTNTRTESFLRATSYSFFFNGLFMLVSSILSATSSYYLPGLFYYVMFQGTGGVLYIFTCIMMVRESHDVGLTPMVGLMTGGMHAFHCAYSTYKNYYD